MARNSFTVNVWFFIGPILMTIFCTGSGFFSPNVTNSSYDDNTQETVNKTNASRKELWGKTVLLCKEISTDVNVCPKQLIRNPHTYCYCDNLCLLYGDCCRDHFYHITRDFSIFSLKMLQDEIHDIVSEENNYTLEQHFRAFATCHQLFQSTQQPLLVISTCPPSFGNDPELNKRCNEPNSDHPVSHNIESITNFVYKNQYCALCHGLQSHDIINWSVEARCPQNTTFPISETELKKCRISYKAPGNVGQERYCIYSSFSSDICDSDYVFTNWSLACGLYLSPVQVENKIFRNEHCIYCSENGNESVSCIVNSDINSSNKEIYFGGINMIFNFNFNLNAWTPQRITCGKTEILHKPSNTCKKLKCPEGFLPDYGLCKRDFENVPNTLPLDRFGNTNYNITVILTVKSIIEQINKNRTISDISDAVKNVFGENVIATVNLIEKRHINQTKKTPIDYTLAYKTVLLHYENFSFEQFMYSDIYKFINATFPCGNSELKVTVNNIPNVEDIKCQAGFNLYAGVDATLQRSNGQVYVMDSKNIKIELQRSRFILLISNLSKQPRILAAYYCLNKDLELNCSFISYDKLEYSVKKNGVLIIPESRVIENNSYSIINGTLYACAEQSKSTADDRSVEFEIVFISTVSLSLISLTIILVLHIVFPKLRNFNGKLLMNLSFSLLIGQISFIMNTYAKGMFCSFLVVFTHFSWLSVFAWTSVLAFDYSQKFGARSMISARNANDSLRLRRYSIVAYGLPVIVVTICIVIHYGTELNIGYGDESLGFCWISNIWANTVAYAIPMLVSIVFNFVCFAIALYGIESTVRKTNIVENEQKRRCHCLIYTKLFVLLGLTWAINYTLYFTQISFILYLSTALNGLQGFFILIGFVTNSRVLKILKEKHQTSNTTNDADVHTLSSRCQLDSVHALSTRCQLDSVHTL